MKKKLFSIALLFTMVFAFAACGVYLPDYGEQGYVANLYMGLHYTNNEAPTEAIIHSTQELKEFCDAVQFEDSVFSTSNRETVHSQFIERLNSYSSRFFKDNVLVAVLEVAGSGGHTYSVKSVEAQEGTLNATLQYWIPGEGVTTDIKVWGILIEYPKGDYTQLNVEVEEKHQRQEADGNTFYVTFTHEASLATIDHDYTPADFPELDFAFTVEDNMSSITDFVRQALAQESIDSQTQYRIDIFVRGLKFTLAEPSKENVLRAVELFSEQEDVWLAYPAYEYFWEED